MCRCEPTYIQSSGVYIKDKDERMVSYDGRCMNNVFDAMFGRQLGSYLKPDPRIVRGDFRKYVRKHLQPYIDSLKREIDRNN